MHWDNSLIQGNPFAALRRDFERKIGLDNCASYAGMSVAEFNDRWVIEVDVPGVKESELDITLEDGVLVISGDRNVAIPEDARELFSDRQAGKFRRVLKIREGVDRSAIEADLKDGVLTLTLKRLPESSPMKINVRTGKI